MAQSIIHKAYTLTTPLLLQFWPVREAIVNSMMGLMKCVFGVAVVALLSCRVNAQFQYGINRGQKLQQRQNQVFPQQQQQPQPQPQIPIPQAPFDKCQVEEGEKIKCGTPETTAVHCLQINCCFDGQQCYYGKAVTVQCTRDGQFVLVVAREATLPNIDVKSLGLLQNDDLSCSPAGTTSTFAIFQFPVTACGTTMKEENGYVVYENHMSTSYNIGTGPRGSITRDSHFELLFQCRYAGTAVEALIVEVNNIPPPQSVAAPGPLRVELRLANGQCITQGCVEEKAAYTSYYTNNEYPITKYLKEPVYVEVRILDRTDSNLHLMLEHCWATPTPNPDSLPQWELISEGCPYTDDHQKTTLVPLCHTTSGLLYPNHYKRFIVKMFAFVDEHSFVPQQTSVFIHCTTAVCRPSSTDSCDWPCHRQRRAVRQVKVLPGKTARVSSKRVFLLAAPQGTTLAPWGKAMSPFK